MESLNELQSSLQGVPASDLHPNDASRSPVPVRLLGNDQINEIAALQSQAVAAYAYSVPGKIEDLGSAELTMSLGKKFCPHLHRNPFPQAMFDAFRDRGDLRADQHQPPPL